MRADPIPRPTLAIHLWAVVAAALKWSAKTAACGGRRPRSGRRSGSERGRWRSQASRAVSTERPPRSTNAENASPRRGQALPSRTHRRQRTRCACLGSFKLGLEHDATRGRSRCLRNNPQDISTTSLNYSLRRACSCAHAKIMPPMDGSCRLHPVARRPTREDEAG